jgi:hypothetical protein
VVPSVELCSKFLAGVQGRVHRPAQLCFGPAKRWYELGQTHLADDHEIHVASGEFFCTRHRAIDKRAVDTFREAIQPLAEGINYPRRLDEQALQFWEKRAVRIWSEIDPVAILAAAEDTGVNKCNEFSLKTRRANAKVFGEITEIPPALGMKQGCGQEGLSNLWEKGVKGS